MVVLQGRIRRRNSGKLISVLDHLLRVGDEKVSENIVNAYKERGLTPPEHLETPPIIHPENYIYWEGYQDLQSERIARGFIPITAIVTYCRAYDLDIDTMKRIVWRLDKILLGHWKSNDDAKQAQAEAEKSRKGSLTSSAGSGP